MGQAGVALVGGRDVHSGGVRDLFQRLDGVGEAAGQNPFDDCQCVAAVSSVEFVVDQALWHLGCQGCQTIVTNHGFDVQLDLFLVSLIYALTVRMKAANLWHFFLWYNRFDVLTDDPQL